MSEKKLFDKKLSKKKRPDHSKPDNDQVNQHRARKRFGQHFLHDVNIIDKMLSHLAASETDTLVEIGPGMGALTLPILDQGHQLTAIEMDRDLISFLQSQPSCQERLTLHQADALKFDFCQLRDDNNKIRIIGNLPYNISTPLLFHLLDQRHCIIDMHFMLQKEVVDRMAAKPGSKIYGRLSVMLQSFCQIESLFDVSASCFNPPPKVESSVVWLRPYETPPYAIDNQQDFALLVKAAFQQRRKTLRNNVKNLLTDAQIEACDIDPQARAETLSIDNFACLSNHLAAKS